MALDNYRDISTSATAINAGFQFEFKCSQCARKWTSDFVPYRVGQVTGFLTRFAFLFSGASTAGRVGSGVTDYGSRTAKEKALEKAQVGAAQRYVRCDECRTTICNDCFDPDAEMCKKCVDTKAGAKTGTLGIGGGAATANAAACPNCSSPASGGRFCAECGFDMASTHKSCPGCGVLCERKARFCGDCGHGF